MSLIFYVFLFYINYTFKYNTSCTINCVNRFPSSYILVFSHATCLSDFLLVHLRFRRWIVYCMLSRAFQSIQVSFASEQCMRHISGSSLSRLVICVLFRWAIRKYVFTRFSETQVPGWMACSQLDYRVSRFKLWSNEFAILQRQYIYQSLKMIDWILYKLNLKIWQV